MIPASVSGSLNYLLAAVNSAYPVSTATVSALASMQQQASGLISTIDSALLADDNSINPPVFVDPLSFAASLTTLVSLAQEETALAELSALAGRAAINLANAGV